MDTDVLQSARLGLEEEGDTRENQTGTDSGPEKLRLIMVPNWSGVKRSMEEILSQWYDDEDVRLLSRFFVGSPPKPESLMRSICNDILQSQGKLKEELPNAIAIFAAVGAVSAILNASILARMAGIRHKCSAAIFLVILAALDLASAILLLLEVCLMQAFGLTVLVTSGIRVCHALIAYSRLLLQYLSVYTLLLILVDRHRVYSTNRARLFGNHRVAAWCLLALIPGLAAVLITGIKDMPLRIAKNAEAPDTETDSFDIHPCVHLACTGSSLINHPLRMANDRRVWMSKLVAISLFLTLAAVVLPIYIYVWSMLGARRYAELYYEEERKDIASCGREVNYFNPSTLSKRSLGRLPVIMEVLETESNSEKSILFPYSLQVWHTETHPSCGKVKEDSFLYDRRPLPENSPLQRPIHSAAARLKFDTELNKRHQGPKDRPMQRPVHRWRSFEGMKKNSMKYGSFPEPWADTNTNQCQMTVTSITNTAIAIRNSPPPALQQIQPTQDELRDHAHKETQTEDKYCFRFSSKFSESPCQEIEELPSQHRASFLTSQIVFSINCCCNRTAAIERVNDIRFPMSNETARRKMQSTKSMASSQGVETHGKLEGQDQIQLCELNLRLSDQRHDATEYSEPLMSLGVEPTSAILGAELMPGNNNPNLSGSLDNVTNTKSISDDASSKDLPLLYAGYCQDKATHVCRLQSRYIYNPNPIHNDKNTTEHHQARSSGFFQRQAACVHGNEDMNCSNTVDMSFSGNRVPVRHQSMMVFTSIRHHFETHSEPLDILGVPETLTSHVTSATLGHSRRITLRLAMMTVVYILLIFLPWLPEVHMCQFHTILAMSHYISGLTHFTSLLLFSPAFFRDSGFCTFCHRNRKRTSPRV